VSTDIFANLAWLPQAAPDFSAQCKRFADDGANAGARLRALANTSLNENQLTRLAKVIASCRAGGVSLAPLTPFKLGIISNATTHAMVPPLVATAPRHGLIIECIEADYGMVVQEALNPASPLNAAQVDAVLLALDYRGLPLQTTPGDAEAAERTIEACLDYVGRIAEGLRANGGALCIFQSLAPPVEAVFGNLDSALPGTLRHLINAFNTRLAARVAGTENLFLDVAALASTVGLANWHDPTLWNMAKFPFASAYLPLYAEHVCRIAAALRGKSRRCLILDLDNTVWSGVIGDDGIDGIVIGQGDATGEAHLEVQRTALSLRDRGVVLSVSSKNTDEIARQPFRKHPEMLLREDHIAVFQANWNDKATNIKAIAEELALGLESMAFLDDNPVERSLVRTILPQVAVPELPQDPALYARTLLAAGYFESVAFSVEDKGRAEMYQDNARRVALQKEAGDVGSYLKSLNMQITFAPFNDTGRSRISQLVGKSNQFNLRSQRYTEAQIAEFQRDAGGLNMQIRLSDVFGDNGMICVIICRAEGADSWFIDTWLMSCRVLGRGVEQATLNEILLQAKARGVRYVFGEYLPTDRNKLVEDHYAKLGFELVNRGDTGATLWRLDVEQFEETPVHMDIVRVGGEVGAA
jgi:FkbH-like protein